MASFKSSAPIVLLFCLLRFYSPWRLAAAYVVHSTAPGTHAPDGRSVAHCTKRIYVGPIGANMSAAYWLKATNQSKLICGDGVVSGCPSLELAFQQYYGVATKTTPGQAELPCFLLAASPTSNCEILLGQFAPTSGTFLSSNDSTEYVVAASEENGCRTAVIDVSERRALKRGGKRDVETHYALLVFTDAVTLIGVRFIARRMRQPRALYLIETLGGITITRCEFLLGPGVSALKASEAATGDVHILITDTAFTGIRAVDDSHSATPHNQPLLALSDWGDEVTYNESASFTISGCSFSNFSSFHVGPLILAKLEDGGIAVINTTFLNINTMKSILRVSYPDTHEGSPEVKIEGCLFQNVTCQGKSSCVQLVYTHVLIISNNVFHKESAPPAMISIYPQRHRYSIIHFRRCHFLSTTYVRSLGTLDARNSTLCNGQRQAYWVYIVGHQNRTVTFTDCSFSSGPTLVGSKSNDILFNGTTTLYRLPDKYLVSPLNCEPFVADYASITVAGPVVSQVAPGFPKYPSVRKTIIHQVRYWRSNRFNTGPGGQAVLTHQMNFSLILEDMYCRIPYCLATGKRGHRYYRKAFPLKTPRLSPVLIQLEQAPCYYQCTPKWRFYDRKREATDDTQVGSSCMCNLYSSTNNDHPRKGPCTGESREAKSYADFELCTYPYYRKSKPLLVINRVNALKGLISTPASWMLFRSSTVQCYKNWRGYIYVLRNCSRDNWAALGKVLGWANVAGSPITALRETMLANSSTATNVVIGAKFAATPWSFLTGPPTISHHYCQHRKFGPQAKDCDDHIGSITLMPAPGEHVSFGIDTLDNGLSQVDVVLTLKIEKFNQDVEMLRLSTKTHETVEELAFLGGGSLSDFALLGRPMTKGFLKVTMSSDGLGISQLRIPFLLRPCNMGFTLTDTTITGKTTKTCTLVKKPGVIDELNGRSIQIAPGFWAGDLSPILKNNLQHHFPLPVLKIPLVGSAKETLGRTHFKHQLGIAQCTHRFCLNDHWWIHSGEGSGCVPGYTGPLCGKCEGDRSLRVVPMTCAEYGSPTLNIYIYISLIILFTLLAFIVMFYFNFGMSPLVDSWLFCIQVGLFLPTNSLKELGTLGTVLTFGLGHLRTTPELNRLQATFLLLTQPVTLLLAVVAVRIAASYSSTGNVVQRQQKHMRLIRVMWFGLVYSYTMLTFTSLNVLSCTTLDNKLVLAMDGSIECFKGNHIPYAVCAVVIIALIIIPPPILIILPQAKRKLFFKGFIDQACCMYHDNRRWWASVNLVRRIAVAVILSQFRRMEEKTIFLTIFLIGYLLLHTCWLPLSQKSFLNIDSNAMEKYFLYSLVLLSILNSVSKAAPSHLLAALRVSSYILIYAPTVVLLCAIMFRQCFSEHGGFGRLRNVSWRIWSEQRRVKEAVNTLAAHNLAAGSGLTDPLILTEMKNEEPVGISRSGEPGRS